jgi:nicotinate phosphoribosyltransferase
LSDVTGDGLTPLGPGTPLGLLTDLYELRMAQTCLRDGMVEPATFSLYIRPHRQRPWFLAAGTGRAIELLERFTYGPEEIDYLRGLGLGDDVLAWLAELEPQGDVWAVPDGTVMIGEEPILEVTAPLPYAMLLETAMMNVVQLTTLIATKAARCSVVAEGRQLADFGLRRAQGLETGVEAARAAYIGGVGATSNVEAGRRYGIPVVGTMAHSFVQAREDEAAAFRSFGRDHPENTILLVDTYDTIEGVRRAIEVGDALQEDGRTLHGIRLDSGDLGLLAEESRRMLDEAGHTETLIYASGGIDEWRIAELSERGAPIDAYGVGTSLTTSRDFPAFDIVYKLVEYAGQPRAKYSAGKVLLPGAKQVFRSGGPQTDVLARRGEELEGAPLLAPLWSDGEALHTEDLEEARARAEEQLGSIPESWRHPDGPEDLPEPVLSDELERVRAEVERRELGG